MLINLAAAYWFQFPLVLERLWGQSNKWTDPQRRARSLMAMARFIAPTLNDWLHPIRQKTIRDELRVCWSGEPAEPSSCYEQYLSNRAAVQRWLAEHQVDIWRCAGDLDTQLASAAAMLLGTMCSHDADDLRQMLELCTGRSEAAYRASLLLAVGRACQYTKVTQGAAAVADVPERLKHWFETPDVLTATAAVCAHVLLDPDLPGPASAVLSRALSAPEPAPQLWGGEDGLGNVWNTRDLARRTLAFARPDKPALALLREEADKIGKER